MATAAWYGKAFLAAFNKEVDWIDDDIRATLHTSGYTPDQDVHDYVNDLSNEITGTGYTAGGVALTGKTLTYTGATNKVALDASDAQWTTATLTARHCVVSDRQTGVTSTEPLLGYQNFGADFSSSGGTFLVQWHASGILEITVGAEA
jgi:hypothetical protein